MKRRELLGGVGLLLAGCRSMDQGAVDSGGSSTAVIRNARRFGLLETRREEPRILVRLRYAGRQNLTGRPLYPANMPCLIHRDTLARLKRVADKLEAAGMRLVIWDAYRPPEAQTVLWQRVGNEDYVHRPGKDGRWSWHCYGRAVDVTLADATGKLLAMPSDLDDFSAAARVPYAGNDPAVAQRLELLRIAMLTYGMQPISEEWWHFHDPVSPAPAQPVRASDIGLIIPA